MHQVQQLALAAECQQDWSIVAGYISQSVALIRTKCDSWLAQLYFSQQMLFMILKSILMLSCQYTYHVECTMPVDRVAADCYQVS